MLRFQQPKINQEVTKVKWVNSLPVASLTQGSPIDFFISGSGDDYLDLQRTMLNVKISVLHADDSPLVQTDLVAPINLMLHSLFSQVDVSLQNIQITNGVGSHYPYKAYWDVLLNHGRGAKTSQLTAQGFYKDVRDMEDVNCLRKWWTRL